METKRLNLAEILADRDYLSAKDGLLTNCYHEDTPLGPMVVKRPGFTTRASLGAGCAQGGITYNDTAVWVIKDALATSGAGIPNLTTFVAGTTPTKPSNATLGTAHGGYLVSHLTVLYSLGGRNNTDTTISVYKSVNDGTSWSTISTPWTTTTIGNNGTSYACNQMAVSYGGKIYALGIIGSRNIQSSPDGVTWTQETSDLSGGGTRIGCALIEHNSLLYAFLGSPNSGVTTQIYTSPDGATWTQLNSGITAIGNRAGFNVFSLNGVLYLTSGMDGTNPFNDVWTSVDNGNNWILLTSTTAFSARTGASAWVYQNRLWIGGGGTTVAFTTCVNDIWSTDNGSAWLLGSPAATWSARRAASCTVHNSKMYIGPGNSGAATVLGLYSASATVSVSIPLVPAPGTSCLPFQMTLVPATLTTPTGIFFKSNQVAYYYNGLAVSQIIDADYPPDTVYGTVYLDGTVYVMNSRGVIYGSDLNNPNSWSALNFISANSEGDEAIALVRQLNYVVAFKQSSTEFFYDAGNATGSPLSKVLNALLLIGCASAGSIASSDNSLYFMANSQQKGRSIMKMEGYTPKYISNQYVDRILNADSLATVYAYLVKINGHVFYVLTLVHSGITLVLDEVTGEWHKWSHYTANSPVSVSTAEVQSDGSILITMALPHGLSDGDVVTILGATPSAVNGQFNIRYDSSAYATTQFTYVPASPVSGAITGSITAVFYTESYFPGVYYARSDQEDRILDETLGLVYAMNINDYQDSNNPINVKVRTKLNDFGLMATKRYSRFELVGDKETTNVLVRYSDDDYNSWSLYRIIPMAQKRAKISNLGSGRRRAFELRNTENTALRLLAAEIDFDVGAF